MVSGFVARPPRRGVCSSKGMLDGHDNLATLPRLTVWQNAGILVRSVLSNTPLG